MRSCSTYHRRTGKKITSIRGSLQSERLHKMQETQKLIQHAAKFSKFAGTMQLLMSVTVRD